MAEKETVWTKEMEEELFQLLSAAIAEANAKDAVHALTVEDDDINSIYRDGWPEPKEPESDADYHNEWFNRQRI
jgi:hypothetical protein